MGYKSSIKNWEGLAQNDALWSILTDSKRKGEKWNKDQFFASGKSEVDGILNYIQKNGVELRDVEQVLDFGCGAGRISRGLASHFQKVVGIDASPTMVALAEAENSEYQQKLSFVLNQTDDLKQFPDHSFSAVFSVITLQHIPAQNSRGFIAEFIRILKRDGLLIFQIPTKDVRKLSFIQRLRSALRIRERLALIGIGKGFQMDMHPVAEAEILDIIRDNGGELELAVNTNQTEPDYNGKVEFLKDHQDASGYISRLFVVRKR